MISSTNQSPRIDTWNLCYVAIGLIFSFPQGQYKFEKWLAQRKVTSQNGETSVLALEATYTALFQAWRLDNHHLSLEAPLPIDRLLS